MTTGCRGIGVILLYLAAPLSLLGAGPIEAEPEELRPGLLAQYRSLRDPEATLYRIEAKPAFWLGHSSPHPRLPPGRFEVVWTGVLNLSDPAPLTFDAFLCGEVTMEVDGVRVLEGRGESETARIVSRNPLPRPPGLYRLRVQYRSLADRPARLQLGWEGRTFAREPLPAWQLQHLAAELPRAARQDALAEKGRILAGRLGCARCHRGAFPGVSEPPPGPSLADATRRIKRDWLLDWLADPAKMRPDAHMPALFPPDRTGFVERWLVGEHLLGPAADEKSSTPSKSGDHRLGRRAFVSLGCAACHFLPDMDRKSQPDFDRTHLTNLSERLLSGDLAAFLGNPYSRYPDGRMPRLPVPPDTARDLAAYLLMWSKPARSDGETAKPPTADEISAVARRLSMRGASAAGAALVREKRCAQCHSGLGADIPADIAIQSTENERGCLSKRSFPRFNLDAAARKALGAYLAVAGREQHPSPFADRQRLLDHLGCVRCHQRDSDRPSPLEAIGSTLGGAWLQFVPFQRTPRLTYPHQKYTRSHLLAAVRDGVTGLRPDRYSYRMPAFGNDAGAAVQALAEADGELLAGPKETEHTVADPTLASLAGPRLAGFQGYACVSCHVWNGQMLSEPDPGAIGTDLTRVAGRIRRDWFDRYLEGPARAHPGTPMPAIFIRGQPATLDSVLNGDPRKQKDALWSYLARGKDAPSPKPPPPMPIATPSADEPPLVGQIPLRLPDGKVVESICILYGSHDLIVYDVGANVLHSGYTAARVLRETHGRLRSFRVSGTPIGTGFRAEPSLQLLGGDKPEPSAECTLDGYDRLVDGVRIRWQARFAVGTVDVTESLRLVSEKGKRRLVREFRFAGVPAARTLELRCRVPPSLSVNIAASLGEARGAIRDDIFRATLSPDKEHVSAAILRHDLPAPATPPTIERTSTSDTDRIAGSLERPGYRATVYPRPKTTSGEDRVMPSALAVHPKDGRVFVASMKTGEILVLRDPDDDGKKARFDNYTHGLFQEAYSMLAEPDALYVLHRRNLTRIRDSNGDGVADRFDRVFALPHGIADSYDYAYGLARDRNGAFVMSFAPYANTHLPGSGGALRMTPGKKPREVAFGFRNPLGWCSGPEGEIFFTDNQGEWVATNKLCHLVEGRFYGFPNPAQRRHADRPAGKTTVWVPYAWAKSINGVAYDNSGGKFGPFAGQLFLAELMFGGAIVRADVEKVNGEYQGVCFPFWGRGLLGPLTLAFDPRGRLWVGGITEPGWMAQPDRGALFRIDFTGRTPFEMKTIRVLPHGFRIVFTQPVSPREARNLGSYQIEHYRYEYTGAYGSPELDRTRLAIERVELSPDGRSVDLITAPLVKGRVYMIQAEGVRSSKGETLVHPAGAYTLNEIPTAKP
jgi:glucose/arabinose dehydrogenase